MSLYFPEITIGYIVSSLNYGGVEKFVIDLANNIDTQYYKPVIISLTEAAPLAAQLKNHIKIYYLDKKAGNDFSIPKKIKTIVAKEQIKILHSNNWSTFVEAVAAKLICKIPLVHTQHGMEKNDVESSVKRIIRNKIRLFSAYCTDNVVVVSDATKQFVNKEWGFPERKINHIYNGVDTEKYSSNELTRNKIRLKHGINEQDIVIGSVGRLMPVKNYPNLLKAFAKITNKNSKLILVGEGPDLNNLKMLGTQLKIADRTRFLGARPDIDKMLNIMDIFVLPSFSEGVSLSLLEAMAVSLPCVATAVGGNVEVVEHNKNGLLVQSDDFLSLANTLNKLIENYKLRKTIGQSALNRVNQLFSFSSMLHQYQSIYSTLVSS